MPADLTIFAARYLVFIAVGLTAVILAVRLWPRPRLWLLRWAITAGLVLLLSDALAQLGGAIYTDPRPFTTSHLPPLIPHAPDNGFPSDHALLAAALVAVVAMADVWWSLPLVVLAMLVAWAWVGAGLHHPIDVVGSTVLVLAATLLALLAARAVLRWLVPHVLAAWHERRLYDRHPRSPAEAPARTPRSAG